MVSFEEPVEPPPAPLSSLPPQPPPSSARDANAAPESARTLLMCTIPRPSTAPGASASPVRNDIHEESSWHRRTRSGLIQGVEWTKLELRYLQALRPVGRAGTVRVGSFQSTSSKLVPDAISALAERVPDAQLELHEAQGDAELLHLVEVGELDLTFCVLPALDGPFVTVELMIDPFMLLVSADHPLAARGRIQPEDLDGLPVVSFHHCRNEHRVEAHLAGRNIVPRFVTRVDDNGALQGMAAAGLGAALMPRMTIDAADPRVRVLDLQGLVPDRVLGIAS